MAIRQRDGRKKPFLVYWRNPFTQKIESKSVATRAEAEKLNAYVQYQLKYERDNFQPVEPEPQPPEPVANTLESVFYLYLRDRNFAKENLAKTLQGAKAIMERYGDTEIEKVDMKLLLEMQKNFILAGNKGATVHRKMGIIKATLHWAHRNGFIENIPVFPVSPKSEAARNVPPSPEEVSRLYKVSPTHLKRVLILGFMFGMRVGPCELLRLKWDDINLTHAVIRIPNAKKGIGEPWREVPIKTGLLPLFQKWKEEDCQAGAIYVIHYRGRPIKSIRTSWKRALAQAGITRYIRPYDLRHSFATEALSAGADYGYRLSR